MEGGGFGGFGFDPEMFQRALGDMAEQARQQQSVAFADSAIHLAVQMTVAAIGQMTPTGTPEQQADQLRSAITRIYPECVTLVREARQGLS
jgi:hypothetical protein